MNSTARKFETASDCISHAAAVRNRLMNPVKAVRPAKPAVELRVVNVVVERPLWKREVIRFEEHVRAWQWHLASRKKDKHVEFVRRRSIEMGVSYVEVIGPSRSKNVTHARQRIMYELRMTFDLSYPHIGRLVNKDHTCAVAAVRKFQLREKGHCTEKQTKLVRLRADAVTMAKVRKLYEDGWSIADIAREIHCSRETFVAVAKEQGWYDPDRAMARAHNFAAMKRDYDAGMPIKELAEKHGIAARTWANIRRKLGIEQREHHTKCRGAA
ncbi:helix-turn-helix domain-containing protein [Rhizobium sp. 21-4511-3d]